MKFKTIPNKKVPGMHFVRWPDRTLSADHYNLSWANHHKNMLNEEFFPTPQAVKKVLVDALYDASRKP